MATGTIKNVECYQAGDSVSYSTGVFYGYTEQSGGVSVFVLLPKVIPENLTITVTMTGVNWVINQSGLNTSTFTYSQNMRMGDNLVRLMFTGTAYNNFLPCMINIGNLKITFS